MKLEPKVQKKTARNILMICYYYPPLTDVGCKRSVAFSKYFLKHGWNPYVVSVKNPDKGYCQIGTDLPPEGIHIHYTYSILNVYRLFGKLHGFIVRLLRQVGVEIKRNYFYELFCIPDVFSGWIPMTFMKCLYLQRQYNADYLYVSSLPFSAAIIGALLGMKTGKPVIVDFRDPFALEKMSLSWSQEFLRQDDRPCEKLILKLRKGINRAIEAFILRHTNLFIVTTEETREAYIGQYPDIENRTFAVHNGFDRESMDGSLPPKKFSKFTVVYTGEFYFYAPNSELFFEALALLKSRGEVSRDDFQFLFYGDGRHRVQEIAAKCGVDDLVHVYSRVSHREIMNIIRRSHLELIRIVKLMISTKVFEGISLNIPLLATIPEGEVEGIIKRYSPSSYIITDNSPENIAEAIVDARVKYNENEIEDNRVSDFLAEFSRETLTLKLMKIVEEQLG